MAPFIMHTPKTTDVQPIEVEPYIPSTWECIDCSPAEQYVLEQLQEKTKITDKNALATILGEH